MAIPHTYEYPRAALTVDCVVFGLDERTESAADSAGARAVYRQMGIAGRIRARGGNAGGSRPPRTRRGDRPPQHLPRAALHLRRRKSRPARARRSVDYYALVKLRDHNVHAATDASAAAWFPVHDVPRLAFDHADILPRRSPVCTARSASSPSASSCCRRNSRSRSFSASTSSCSDAPRQAQLPQARPRHGSLGGDR